MRAIGVLTLTVILGGAADAQRRPSGSLAPAAGRQPSVFDARQGRRDAGATVRRPFDVVPSSGARADRGSYWAVAASALAPGTGQALLGEQRYLPYAAFELFSWALYASHARDARARRDEYRALASSVARAKLSANRPTGDFEYYERLEHYAESGRFDLAPGGDINPETDTTTFNGSIWFLARRTFWKDVNVEPLRSSQEWQQAERFYRSRAYQEDFLWSWRNAQLEFDEYRRLIRGANDANRRSVQDLGLIIANHALSLVDAFITIRVRRRVDVTGDVRELQVTLPGLR